MVHDHRRISPQGRTEKGAIRKRWQGRITVALVFPSQYAAGMTNLGFQSVYQLLNEMPQVVCERFFSLADKDEPIRSVENGRLLTEFDIIAFSVSFENDYFNVLELLHNAGIPLRSNKREDPHPLVIAGGVACFLNPEPIAQFIDLFLLGEAEILLPPFFKVLDLSLNRHKLLNQLAVNVPGVYVPALYHPEYHLDGTLARVETDPTVPPQVERIISTDLSQFTTQTTIVSSETAFESPFLVEVGRGCPHGCRFCSAGYIYRPVRFRRVEQVKAALQKGKEAGGRVGLVSAAVSDHPDLQELCQFAAEQEIPLAFSSLRADAMTPDMAQALASGGIKTATIAPEAGSERMRRVIKKGITEADIISAAKNLTQAGILNLKLYFMIGLPTETMEDIEAIVTLVRQIKIAFLHASRPLGRMGTIGVSINCFVPKPATPFQWAAMFPEATVKKRLRYIQKKLGKEPNITVRAESCRLAYYQALISRGDRRVGDLLEALVCRHNGHWRTALRETAFDVGFYTTRKRSMNELFPWDFIATHTPKAALYKEFQRALSPMEL